MYTSQRPEAVIKAIHDKFERVAFHEKNTEYGHGQLEENGGRSPWLNMGKVNETIIFGERYLKTGDTQDDIGTIKLMCVESSIIYQKLLILSNVSEDINKEENNGKTTFLDLGTGDGSVLIYLNKAFGIGYERMIGISAGDNRQIKCGIPDESYILCNIDLLNQVHVC